MKNLSKIALGLFVVSNTAYDLIAVCDNTRLNIMYFSFMYLTLLIVSLNEFNRDKDAFSLVLGIGFTVRIIWELTKWNMPFDAYMRSVNDYEKGVLFSFMMIALILIPITNGRIKRNNKGSDA